MLYEGLISCCLRQLKYQYCLLLTKLLRRRCSQMDRKPDTDMLLIVNKKEKDLYTLQGLRKLLRLLSGTNETILDVLWGGVLIEQYRLYRNVYTILHIYSKPIRQFINASNFMCSPSRKTCLLLESIRKSLKNTNLCTEARKRMFQYLLEYLLELDST